MRSIHAVAIALLVLTQSVQAEEAAQAQDARRTLTVTGVGEASAAPDMANINLGVASEARTARAALDANSAAMRQIMQTLEELAIASKDIRTSGFNVQPRYQHDPNRQDAPRIVGYQVNNTLHLAIRDLARLGDLLDAVVSQGSNTISGLSFGFSDPDTLVDQARRAAGADARRKAELYAEGLGIELSAIVQVKEAGSGPAPVPMLARAMAMDAAPVPVAAGEQTVSASVTVTWEIK